MWPCLHIWMKIVGCVPYWLPTSFLSFFFWNTSTCRLCVIYVRECNIDSNIEVMITRFIWIICSSMSAVREKPLHSLSLTQSLTHSLNQSINQPINHSFTHNCSPTSSQVFPRKINWISMPPSRKHTNLNRSWLDIDPTLTRAIVSNRGQPKSFYYSAISMLV